MTQKNIDTMDLIVSKMAHGKTLSKALHEVYTKRNVVIPYREEWLGCKLTSLKMSMRTTQALLRNKMETIGDVVNYTNEYKITYATPYDMFPHTKHVEMLVALERK